MFFTYSKKKKNFKKNKEYYYFYGFKVFASKETC